ncbi:MAG TPA: Hsp20/alpha crystallin family protein [Chloroflexi bacterium]|nr:MAG: heat-shock protein Hsp20 [Anaerolineaceae bacterium 4572_5.2]HEY84792.1 Hsp20/alpha crystallin family protein [Chloroflexota bacterium]
MANKAKPIQEVEKQEIEPASDAEPTRDVKIYVPRVDIYETDEDVFVVADAPGVDENSMSITLEKNILTLEGQVEISEPDNFDLVYSEYGVGDYQRSFTLSEEIDRNKIEASINGGVLRLRLPKAAPAKARKIAVKAG